MRRAGWGVALLGATCAIAGCGGGAGGGAAAPGAAPGATDAGAASPGGGAGGAIVWGKPAEVLERDPAKSFNGVDWEIYGQVYDGLTTMGDDLKVEPDLAERWEQPSPTKYVFHLRDAKFSNGRAVTADDVVGSLKRVLDPKTAAFWAGNLGPVKKIVATDPKTVEIDLKKPYTPLLASLAHAGASILPMKELEAGTFNPKKQFLGTGPWMEVAHLADQQWTFKRNPHYWQSGYPKASQLIVKIIPDDSARTAALRSGSVNIATFENPDAAKLLSAIPGTKTVIQRTTDYYRLDMNAVNPKSKVYDQTVRQALQMAIDRTQILKLALGGVGEVTPATSPAQSTSCQSSLGTDYFKKNVEKAKQLLASVGASNLKLNLIATPAFAQFPPIAQIIQRNWAAIGVKATIQQLEVGNWEKLEFTDNPSNFDAAMSYNAGFGDPGSNLNNYSPVYVPSDAGWDKKDPGLETLLGQINQLPNGSKRDQLMQQACTRIDVESNQIPLVTRPKIIGYTESALTPVFQGTEGYVDPLRYTYKYTVGGS